MELDTLIRLLPFAFMLHNFEEVLGMEKWTKSIPPYIHKPVTTLQFLIAITLFSALGFAVVFSENIYPSQITYSLVIAGFAGMLFLNVFIPHLFATIYLKKYAPGLFSALILNLPLTALILLKIHQFGILSPTQLILAVLGGGIVGVGLAYVFLEIGKHFARITKPQNRHE